MFKENLELREAVAKKMGWEPNFEDFSNVNSLWTGWTSENGDLYDDLPNFSTDWNDTKILIRWMRERGHVIDIGLGERFSWVKKNGTLGNALYGLHEGIDIIDDNLALAACEAFMEVEI